MIRIMKVRYLEGHEDFVSRLIMGILGVIIRLVNLVTTSPCPAK